MIIKAMEISEATKDAMTMPEVMFEAAKVFRKVQNGISAEEFSEVMFRYSGILSAATATLVASVCLGENKMNEMISEIDEFEKTTSEILSEFGE
jgi:hypothetical protein